MSVIAWFRQLTNLLTLDQPLRPVIVLHTLASRPGRSSKSAKCGGWGAVGSSALGECIG